MKGIVFLLACSVVTSVQAAEPKYLECQIPERSSSRTGADGKQLTTTDPSVTLKITIYEDTSKVAQVFQSGDDGYSFTTEAQFTPTNILYQWTRKRGFLRVDKFSVDRVTLAVELVVQYPGMGTLSPRQGTCRIVKPLPTQI